MKRDVFTFQNVAVVVAIIFCIFFLIGAINATSRNWSLQSKLDNLNLTKQRTKIEVETLKLEQEYYKTDEYQELVAREKLGKMLEGETMVTMRKNSETAIKKDSTRVKNTAIKRSNVSMWLDLIFGE